MISWILLTLSLYFYFRIFKPFDADFRNIFGEIKEILKCLILIFLLFYNSCDLDSSDFIGLMVGYAGLYVLILLIAINLIGMLFNFLYEIYKKYMNKKNTAEKKKKKLSKYIDSLELGKFENREIIPDKLPGKFCEKIIIVRSYQSEESEESKNMALKPDMIKNNEGSNNKISNSYDSKNEKETKYNENSQDIFLKNNEDPPTPLLLEKSAEIEIKHSVDENEVVEENLTFQENNKQKPCLEQGKTYFV